MVSFAKDYQGKGTGLRAIIDLYVFLLKHERDLNRDYIAAELLKLDLIETESQIRDLIQYWFISRDVGYRS